MTELRVEHGLCPPIQIQWRSTLNHPITTAWGAEHGQPLVLRQLAAAIVVQRVPSLAQAVTEGERQEVDEPVGRAAILLDKRPMLNARSMERVPWSALCVLSRPRPPRYRTLCDFPSFGTPPPASKRTIYCFGRATLPCAVAGAARRPQHCRVATDKPLASNISPCLAIGGLHLPIEFITLSEKSLKDAQAFLCRMPPQFTPNPPMVFASLAHRSCAEEPRSRGTNRNIVPGSTRRPRGVAPSCYASAASRACVVRATLAGERERVSAMRAC